MRSIVYYYTHISQPFAEAAATLSRDPGVWLPAPAEPDGTDWRVTLHADGAVPQPLAEHRACVRVGAPTHNDATLLRSIAWRSGVADRLVPLLQADLELASLTGHGCQVSLMGSYRPPLSVVGAAGDRLLGHRVAEACVRRFVLEVAERVDTAMLRT